MEANGRTVRLFLVDGMPTGLITAEIMNWTGHVLLAPRSRLGDALRRPEPERTGVYFLVGDDPDQPAKQRVYIGEGDCVADRIKAHASDENKDFWTKACFLTSKDSNLTKAHVRYLESRLVAITKSADRANIANGNDPANKSLPESDIADMEFFLSQVQVVLPVLGLDFLRPAPALSIVNQSARANFSSAPLELVLRSESHGVQAKAIDVDGDFTVLKGSQASIKQDFVQNHYAALRKSLIDDNKLILAQSGDHYFFSDDVIFSSPSAAAAVIYNRNSNGRTAWKIAGTEQASSLN